MTLDGELAPFLRAVGSEAFSPEHLAVIALAGPAMDSHDDVRDGSDWQYQVFPRSGVTVQIKDGRLVGALIRLHDEEGGAVYPSPDQLIIGIELPSSRTELGAHFGRPRLSTPDMDLYLVDHRYLRFDFEQDRSAAVTIVQPGVEA